MYGIELIIITIGTFGCALASPSPTISAAGLLIFWRVIMVWKRTPFSLPFPLSFYPILSRDDNELTRLQGVGIGGDYPLSSVITSEYGHYPKALRLSA
jgi:PHS family inorganic phosphate transporter-like MFS transporter